jgi:hypothetical protein
MWSESGQGTVEYIGIVLVVAVLLGAIAGGLGVPALGVRIAASVVGTFAGTLAGGTSDGGSAGARPSAEEQAAFDEAINAGIPPDDRPSLADIRRSLIARHGDETGRELYRRLVVASVRATIPGLGGAVTFATAGPANPNLRGPVSTVSIGVDRSLAAPSNGDAGEIETAVGAPNVHVVTVSEADEALDHALNPGVSWSSVAWDLVGAVPVAGTASHFGKLAVTSAKLLSTASSLEGLYSVGDDAKLLLAHEAAIPPGMRAGDEVVSWTALRQPVDGAPVRRFRRTAVVRDGVVLARGMRLEP